MNKIYSSCKHCSTIEHRENALSPANKVRRRNQSNLYHLGRPRLVLSSVHIKGSSFQLRSLRFLHSESEVVTEETVGETC